MARENVVVLKVAGWTPGRAVGRGGSFPSADYGAKCACCDVATDTRLKFNPSTGYAATPIAVPVCRDCLPHIQKSNPTAAFALLLVGLVLGAIAWTNGPLWWIPTIACLGLGGAIALTRHQRQQRMQAEGHHVGLQIVAIPGLVQARSTNARFIDDVRDLNPDLAQPRAV